MQLEISVKLTNGADGESAPEKTISNYNAIIQCPEAYNVVVKNIIETIENYIDSGKGQ